MEHLQKLANTIRFLSADAVQEAKSGHPGMPMGTADMAAVLWSKHLRFYPKDTNWVARDRFVLSAGHGSMLLYSLLHLFGFDLSLEEIKNFRQWESKTPGHPEFGLTPGVETTTGPLGQGFANGVGLALSSKMLEARYGDVMASRVFGIVSDGDLMEGVSAEAASLAGHLQLGNIVYLYDDNNISIGGDTGICFTESVPERFSAYGWHVQSVDGHDFDAVDAALSAAIADERPSIICARTTIGFGSPNKANTPGVHGSPLGDEELKASKEALSWPTEPRFFIPEEVAAFCAEVLETKSGEYSSWSQSFEKWSEDHPEKRSQLDAQLSREIPADLDEELLKTFDDAQKEASRSLSGKAIQTIALKLPFFLGGSADLEPSNLTLIKDAEDITTGDFSGKNIRFGVREHAMGSLVNGLAYTQSWIPYAATFLVFADYMRPPIRLAALSHLQSLFIFTHDSFWVGEDGPTHEPIEQIESLRVIPGLQVFRPADGKEVAACYSVALKRKDGPSALLFTRQKLEPLSREKDFEIAEVANKGAYIVKGVQESDRVIVATGSEVQLACDAADILAKAGLHFRVVSMPCREIFLKLSQEEQAALVPEGAKKVSIEAGICSGWREIVGRDGLCIGIDHYGASAPGETLAEKFGFTPEQVAEKIQASLA